MLIGFGGDSGDCSTYHGWLVAAPESGRGKLGIYEVAHRAFGGAIWAGGDGPVVDPSGTIWLTTGNGFRPVLDDQESVLKLSPEFKLLDRWTPPDWRMLDVRDFELGTSEPLLLPGGLVFVIGKAGEGFIFSTSHLGGIGAAPVFEAHVCDGAAFGGSLYSAGVIYVPCFGNGLKAPAWGPVRHQPADRRPDGPREPR